MYNLLIVDDEPIAKVSLQHITDWSRTNFQIAGSASSCIEALRFIERSAVDAVITDLQMPGMDGITLIRALHQHGFTGPILALSNYSDYNLVRGALTEGAFDYMLKVNLNETDLLHMLEKMSSIIRQADAQSSAQLQKDALIETQKRNLSLSALRDYFLDEKGNYAFPESSVLLPAALFPATICTILIGKETVANTSGAAFIEMLIQEIFEDTVSILTLQVHRNELLCIISEDALRRHGKNIHSKLKRLDKQLHVYTSIPSLITYICCAQDVLTAKQMYWACVRSYGRTYYNYEHSPLQLVLGKQEVNWSAIRSKFISVVLSHMQAENWQAVCGDVDAFLSQCRDLHVSPSQLIDTVSSILWFTHDLKIRSVSIEQISKLTFQLKNTENINQLRTLLYAFFSVDQQAESLPVHSIHCSIQSAMQYVNEFYMKKISLDEISAHVGLNREYLSRLFRAETGTSLFQYITEVRMRKAAELLAANKDILVKEVALDVGIDDPYFFSKKFKTFYGISPTSFYENMHQPINGCDAEKSKSYK